MTPDTDDVDPLAQFGLTLRCPHCPMCGGQMFALITPTQAACGDDACPVFLWDPSESAYRNLTDMGRVREFHNGVEVTGD